MPESMMLALGAREQPITVSQLTLHIKQLLEDAFPELWITGELSNVRLAASGHVYATLKDADTQVRLVMFRNHTHRVSGFEWKDGIAVLVRGKISVYGPQGSYQIVASLVEPMGYGALQAQFEALKKKLSERGWFDAEHKKTIPFLPQRVGVVTSSQGAAIRDILHIIARRFPTMPVDIYPAAVQGKDAPLELIAALKRAEQLHRVDVIIIGRGGGSMEDLWCFNDEALAEAIFHCPLPVVSAVGHEVDFTICDFVADKRAPTPSAAAEIVVPVYQDIVQALISLRSALGDTFGKRLESSRKHLELLYHQLVHPRHRLELQKQALENKAHMLHALFGGRITAEKARLARLKEVLEGLSPRDILKRGYALVSDLKSGALVICARTVRVGDKLHITFSDAPISVSVDDVLLL